MSDFTAIIEKLEGSEAGSGWLDAHVFCELFAGDRSYVEQSPFNGVWCVYEVSRVTGRASLFEWPPRLNRHRNPTTSLDAALALVEERLPGCLWQIEGNVAEIYEPPFEYWASISEHGKIRGYSGLGAAHSPALALIIALCRALQSQEEKKDG